MHYIYAIREESTRGLYKLGRSKHPEIRRSELNTGNPRNLEIAMILGQYETQAEAKYYERVVHENFEHAKVRNEWFAVKMTDLKEIQEFIRQHKLDEQAELTRLELEPLTE